MKQRILTLMLLCAAAFAGTACSDDDNKSSEKTYKVGDFYNARGVKGVVFQVSDGGRHGLIVSLNEGSAQWATEAVAAERTGAASTDDGEDNMEVIEAISGWQTKFPAFAWCGTLNTGGVTDWYLPAFYELASLYEVYAADKVLFNKALTDNGGTAIAPTEESGDYWSSSENVVSGKETEAASFDFFDGTFAFRNKVGVARVRAVYDF